MSCNGTVKHSLFNFSIAGLNFSLVLSNRPFFLCSCMRSSVVSELYVICPIQLVLSAGILSESSWKAKNRGFRLDSAKRDIHDNTLAHFCCSCSWWPKRVFWYFHSLRLAASFPESTWYMVCFQHTIKSFLSWALYKGNLYQLVFKVTTYFKQLHPVCPSFESWTAEGEIFRGAG